MARQMREEEALCGGAPVVRGGGARTPVVLCGSPPDPTSARRRHEDSDKETERPPLDPSSRRSDLAISCGGGAPRRLECAGAQRRRAGTVEAAHRWAWRACGWACRAYPYFFLFSIRFTEAGNKPSQ